MRIAFVNWSSRVAGGAETYIANAAAWLSSRGHEVAFFFELDQPRDLQPIPVPADAPVWTAGRGDFDRALGELERWMPDVAFVHRLDDVALEAQFIRRMPAVLCAHDYHGTCISGSKTFSFPRIEPCERRFGPGCLLRYYPRRTGGLNPLTMLRLYRLQHRRSRLLHRYRAVVTLSRHMREEYRRHDIPDARVVALPLPVPWGYEPASASPREYPPDDPLRLLFVGRMDPLKGGHVLLEAAPRAAATLRRAMDITLIGDGPHRRRWEHSLDSGAVRARFRGWLPTDAVARAMSEAHLLVMPSLWPEPLGLVGLEGAFHGLPTAAFPVGGIPEWLRDGVNGHFAPGRSLDREGLAAAMVACLEDHRHYVDLSRGAAQLAGSLDMARHGVALEAVLSAAVRTASA